MFGEKKMIEIEDATRKKERAVSNGPFFQLIFFVIIIPTVEAVRRRRAPKTKRYSLLVRKNS